MQYIMRNANRNKHANVLHVDANMNKSGESTEMISEEKSQEGSSQAYKFTHLGNKSGYYYIVKACVKEDIYDL